MKKIVLTGLVAFATLFTKSTEEEMEFSQDDAKKVNDELQSRADTIATLKSEVDTLKTDKTSLTDAKALVDAELATANQKVIDQQASIDTLTTENTELKSKPGATTTKSPAAGDHEGDETTKNADAEFCATHSMAENVNYIRAKRNANKT